MKKYFNFFGVIFFLGVLPLFCFHKKIYFLISLFLQNDLSYLANVEKVNLSLLFLFVYYYFAFFMILIILLLELIYNKNMSKLRRKKEMLKMLDEMYDNELLREPDFTKEIIKKIIEKYHEKKKRNKKEFNIEIYSEDIYEFGNDLDTLERNLSIFNQRLSKMFPEYMIFTSLQAHSCDNNITCEFIKLK